MSTQTLQDLQTNLRELYDTREESLRKSYKFIQDYLLYSTVTDDKLLSSLFVLFKCDDQYSILLNPYANVNVQSINGILKNDVEISLYSTIFEKYVVNVFYDNYVSYLYDMLNISNTYVYDDSSLPVFLKI